ncbi:MAG: hypothetical protein AAGA85_06930 [Bacteroidota bacterium]
MRLLLIITAVVLLLGAGYFTYDRWALNKDLSPWNFVPSTAAVVYESNGSFAALEHLRGVPLWGTLTQMGGFSAMEASVNELSTITNNRLGAVLEGNQLLIALHATSRNAFDMLYVLEVGSIETLNELGMIQEHFEKRELQKKVRNYLDFKITEISDGTKSFAFILHKNFLIGSFSAFLVEDAIRTYEQSTAKSFQQSFSELNSITKLEKDQGNLYMNYPSLVGLFGIFADGTDLHLGKSGFLDLTVQERSIEMNGFTVIDNQRNSFLQPHLNVRPGGFDMGSVIPLQTAYVLHYSFDDPEQWGRQYQQYLSSNDPEALTKARDLQATADFDVNYLYELIDEELGLLHFEGIANTYKAFVMEVKDPKAALKHFDDVANQFARTNGDTLYTEYIENTAVRLLAAPEFPQAMLGSVAQGFPSSYYFNYDKFIVFANSLTLLKEIITSIREENTWFKSLRKNAFLERVNDASNISVFINTPDFWPRLSKHIRPHWEEYFQEHSKLMRSIDNVGIQFSQVDGRFFTNIVVAQSEVPSFASSSPLPAKSVVFGQPITTKPFILRNRSRRPEILLQDEGNVLYHLDRDFNINWKVELQGPIDGNIVQLDYYRNGALQYAFVAGNQLHIMEANGTFLGGFPKKVADMETLTHFGLIDYDGSKRYRMTFTDGNGTLYLTDKDGKPLPGWKPKRFSKPLSAPLRHQRVGKRDVMIVTLTSGDIHLFNRRGQEMKGFPILLRSPVESTYHLSASSNFGNTELTSVTVDGEICTINFNGRVMRRDQLFKEAANVQFSTLGDITGNHLLVTSWNDNNWIVMDTNGKSLFQKNYLRGNEIFQQFYRISAGKELILLGDKAAQNLYPFDLDGEMLTGGPIQCSQPISMLYSSRQDAFTLYVAYGNELRQHEINAR